MPLPSNRPDQLGASSESLCRAVRASSEKSCKISIEFPAKGEEVEEPSSTQVASPLNFCPGVFLIPFLFFSPKLDENSLDAGPNFSGPLSRSSLKNEKVSAKNFNKISRAAPKAEQSRRGERKEVETRGGNRAWRRTGVGETRRRRKRSSSSRKGYRRKFKVLF